MNARLIFALAVVALVARAALAQEDVDELKKRYKNMPGGDIIAAQLEAHRAEIEAANAKQKSQMAKLGLDKPAKSAKEILALIPPTPKTVEEARARRGKVEDGNGHKVDGDAKAAGAIHELFVAMTAQGRAQASAPAPSAGIVRNNEGPMIKKLGEDARALSGESQPAGMEFMKASQEQDRALDKSLDALHEAAHKKLGDAGCENEGEGQELTAAQKAKCKAIGQAYLADVNKARRAYLDKMGALTTPFRAKVDGWIKRGAALDADAAAIKSPALQNPVSMSTAQARNALLQALMQLTSADNDSVLKASEKDPVVF